MSLYAPPSKFQPAPSGLHNAVLVDIQDLGETPNKFDPDKMQHRVTVVFELETKMKDGRPFTVREWYGFSMFRLAPFRQMIEEWRGAFDTQKQADKFDVESLIGESALINVKHENRADRIKVKITSVLPAQKVLTPSGHYKRKEGRTPTPEGNQTIDPQTGASTPF